jgi:hypothetical protein
MGISVDIDISFRADRMIKEGLTLNYFLFLSINGHL